MFTLVVRAIIIYLIVIMVFRLMGKRQLGQMQPYELVLTIIVADLATLPIGETSIPLLHGVISLLTLVTMHFFITILTKKSNFFNRLISGKPIILISPNGIDFENLTKLNISIDDLFESIRGCGYFSLDEVEYAIVETNGTVNVLTKKIFSPLTVGDLENKNKNVMLKEIESKTIPITLISEGTINDANLKVANIDKNKVDEILKKAGNKNLKDVLILTLDGNGKIYFQSKTEHFKVFNIDYKQEVV
ncbi:MAG: DUF421 domain-containing protein [Clostridia bacterium]|nr:DUF421 domain-containing protein [Clostridia bacterium]